MDYVFGYLGKFSIASVQNGHVWWCRSIHRS